MTAESDQLEIELWFSQQEEFFFCSNTIYGPLLNLLTTMDGDQLKRNLDKWPNGSKFAEIFTSNDHFGLVVVPPNKLEIKRNLSQLYEKLCAAFPGK